MLKIHTLYRRKLPLIRIFLFSETHTFVIGNCVKYVQLNTFVIFFQCDDLMFEILILKQSKI